MDLSARADHVIRHGGKVLIPTGVSIALPRGFVGLVQPRSGLSWKKDQLAVTGMIDSDYRGEIHVQLFNMGQEMYRVKQGDRIAQLIILRRPKVAWKQVTELSETARGANGFGSTGGE
jgi:dUTP pyrophosphatase